MKFVRSVLLLVLVAAVSACSQEEEKGSEEVEVSVSVGRDRVFVTVFNTSNGNFLWNAWPSAEQAGDVSFHITKNGKEFPSRLQRINTFDDSGVIWLQPGDGSGFTRRLDLLAGRFGLNNGCYEVVVFVTNRKAVESFDLTRGQPGPVIEASSRPVEVCVP